MLQLYIIFCVDDAGRVKSSFEDLEMGKKVH
jgi:hypothetical protein